MRVYVFIVVWSKYKLCMFSNKCQLFSVGGNQNSFHLSSQLKPHKNNRKRGHCNDSMLEDIFTCTGMLSHLKIFLLYQSSLSVQKQFLARFYPTPSLVEHLKWYNNSL